MNFVLLSFVCFLLIIVHDALHFESGNKPQPCTSCGEAIYGPVADGVDFVDMTMKYEMYGRLMPPKRGSNEYIAKIDGFEFWFVNKTNVELFESNTERFMPKYGCFCAYGLSGHDAACPIPPGYCLGPLCPKNDDGYAFIEYNGETKLYCFLGANPKNNFIQNKATYIPNAEKNWNATLQSMNTQNCYNTQCFKTDGCTVKV